MSKKLWPAQGALFLIIAVLLLSASPKAIEETKGETSSSMPQKPLYIAFIWNQHQPSYKDSITGRYTQPWVRLHCVKDYYPMAAILGEYPLLHQTFNLTPSLVLQIEDYVRGARDEHFLLSRKNPEALSTGEKKFLLQNFFAIPRVAREGSQPAFVRLMELKEKAETSPAKFTAADFMDLQILFNLAWIDTTLFNGDEALQALLAKGKGYTEAEKARVLEKHLDIMKKTLALHRELAEKGQIELVTTPFYHPILPLLIDTDSARRECPAVPLPAARFAHPEDARIQVERAVVFHHRVFGEDPAGMWPSEQAVSPGIIPLLADQGIQWAVTDEQILGQSLEISLRGASRPPKKQDQVYVTGNAGPTLKEPDVLYRPYRAVSGKSSLAFLFRDQFLSDLIGFEYSKHSGQEAAGDLLERLRAARAAMKGDKGPHLVTIALDGENCWEHYPEDKEVFLRTLYGEISKDGGFRLVTAKEYLDKFQPEDEIEHLATGSWVSGNLLRWIGSPGKNRAWELLALVRKALPGLCRGVGDKKKIRDAWEALYTAEGSDYAWWFDTMEYAYSTKFDDLYRLHLRNVYRSLGKEPPQILSEPILKKPPR
ncbi:MAG: glycoside hydrolase family 57 protein [bacterium]